jgi:hypothetical protein
MVLRHSEGKSLRGDKPRSDCLDRDCLDAAAILLA